MSALGSITGVNPLTCTLHHLLVIDSSDSTLVQHQLTSWGHFCSQALEPTEVLIPGYESADMDINESFDVLLWSDFAVGSKFLMFKTFYSPKEQNCSPESMTYGTITQKKMLAS